MKWGGAGLTVLLVVVWIGSGWLEIGWSNQYSLEMYVSSGIVGGIYDPSAPPSFSSGVFSGGAHEPSLNWRFGSGVFNKGRFMAIPLWPAVLLSLLATAAAWRADAKYLRRARVGSCAACGYDRAGLAAGAVCPECGGACGIA